MMRVAFALLGLSVLPVTAGSVATLITIIKTTGIKTIPA
jgi:hypothetical protein